MDYAVHIMEYNGSAYQTIETLSGLSGISTVIRPSEDRSELYMGLASNEFLVYENNDGHSLRQTMALSFEPMQISLVHGLIQINGRGSEILFLEFNGSEYVVNQSIIRPDFRVKSISYFQGDEEFVYGGN